jgi:uncharacterized protein (TIGR04222 family)
MNPFDLPGPMFLLFYAGLTAAVFGAMVVARRLLAPRGPLEHRLTDPLLIAHLRAGPSEALRVALASMLRRGLIEVVGSNIAVRGTDAVDRARTPLEHAILESCRGTRRQVSELPRDSTIVALVRERHAALVAAGTLTARSGWRAQALIWLTGVTILGAIAWHKIAIGISRGRPTELLTLMAVAAVLVSPFAVFRRRTPRGERALADLQLLLRDARDRVEREGAEAVSNESLLAATYGVTALAALPHMAAAAAVLALPSWTTTRSSGGGCGAGGGGGSGGGCGGGGCGGGGCGGGGCGGCGS